MRIRSRLQRLEQRASAGRHAPHPVTRRRRRAACRRAWAGSTARRSCGRGTTVRRSAVTSEQEVCRRRAGECYTARQTLRVRKGFQEAGVGAREGPTAA
jgi:hypothetical protein